MDERQVWLVSKTFFFNIVGYNIIVIKKEKGKRKKEKKKRELHVATKL